MKRRKPEPFDRGRPFPFRLIFSIIAILGLIVFVNNDVASRASRYVDIRTEGHVESPTLMDRLFFRRYVWVTDNSMDTVQNPQLPVARSEKSDFVNYKVDLFGVSRVLANRPFR